MNSRLMRLLPLAGVVFAVLSIAGNGSIGDFPDADTPIAKLTPYYAAHHADLARGALLLHWAALFFALFAVAVWARVRGGANPLVAGAILVGAAVDFAQQLSSASVYATLGLIGGKSVIDPAALQAWHVNGAGGGLTTGEGGLALMLVAVALAGIAGRALPGWLAWTALPLGVLQLTPLGFYAEMLFLLWAAVAGVYMTVKPGGVSVQAGTATPVAVPT